mmetsp:Transcript_109343/g.309315  ORF Transcript_109343/g.309315 Transcript_109343/m.309315 type:complete len:273 (-) Transcript_109343:666-1484(-)
MSLLSLATTLSPSPDMLGPSKSAWNPVSLRMLHMPLGEASKPYMGRTFFCTSKVHSTICVCPSPPCCAFPRSSLYRPWKFSDWNLDRRSCRSCVIVSTEVRMMKPSLGPLFCVTACRHRTKNSGHDAVPVEAACANSPCRSSRCFRSAGSWATMQSRSFRTASETSLILASTLFLAEAASDCAASPSTRAPTRAHRPLRGSRSSPTNHSPKAVALWVYRHGRAALTTSSKRKSVSSRRSEFTCAARFLLARLLWICLTAAWIASAMKTYLFS